MSANADPSFHRDREQQFVAHVQNLLADDRLRVDTTRGRRPVTAMIRTVNHTTGAVDLNRLMSQLGLPDRDLEQRMPTGQTIDVVLSQKKMIFFKQAVGKLRVTSVSPTQALLTSGDVQPLNRGDVQKLLSQGPLVPKGDVPTTVVLLSTAGYTLDAHELAERTNDRTLILVEPNTSGGWNVYGPAETKALADLFDPEPDEQKRTRIRQEIEAARIDLTAGGLAADRLAAKTNLPTPWVEAALKQYAKENPGLVAKRLDGHMVLYREGSTPAPPTAAASSSNKSKGSDMPMIDRIKSLFARKGENEKKIAFLSERRTALTQQRDRSYEDLSTLEQQEAALRRQFQETTAAITKRRITSQLLQLRKDLERRQQLLTVLNQQINVVGTHLHNLELVEQGNVAKLPDSEEMATDAAAAEEMLAKLEADTELADSVGSIAHAGLSAEEQALYEELERESAPAGGEPATGKIELEHADPDRQPARQQQSSAASPARTPAQPRRADPEAG